MYLVNKKHIFSKGGAVALKINPTIYCVNFKFAKQYIVCKFFNETAPSV